MSVETRATVDRGAAEPAAAAPRRTAATALRGAGLIVALAALILIALLSVWLGTRDIPFTSTWNVLWNPDGSQASVIIHSYRIPRTVLGVLVGIALGLSGALMQALTRNPLADPGLLGVSLGASTGVVVAIAFLGIGSALGYVWFAFAGAAVASVVVYLLGSAGRKLATPDRLVVAGAAVTAVLYAFNSAVLLLDPRAFNQFRFWTVGALAGRRMDVVWVVLPFVVVGLVVALLLAPSLNALAMGEQLGRALGVNIGRTRVLGVVSVMLLCGAATAAAGPIGFVGLVVPHVARFVVGPDQRWVMAYSMLLAPVLLLGSDVLGRVIGAPGEVQVGIVTAFIGAPLFLALCRRRKLVML
ncbi:MULTISPECIES: iron ABC transporter permease [unclassified Streptomyces]|uniref:FecCD family ABC transporter permease n=1 Tax=unclassified Streptomyces TaxID=2593676 RepID=UPI00224F0B7E|nr:MULTISPECIES: iron chelate uptake ABC transporter family permease subunit [unclassified Streptomyces]MCX4524119.1 iron chelate uptake ABC transporter family permease subunit [Streptomyces sp. NBC_01551]MCX4545363.1 iron chelate uptake ABC transporter family permease subunit [Streptomyces sp. NBC_01565]